MSWMPSASLGTSPAASGGLDTTGLIRKEDKDQRKSGTRAHTGTRYLKAGEDETTITSQGPEPFVTPYCIFQRDSKKRHREKRGHETRGHETRKG